MKIGKKQKEIRAQIDPEKKYTIELSAEQAFGKKNAQLIQLILS